ncbi:hypothetical protein MCOR08_006210 [Pyricularia oryzae]|nr:hypothetical protein MCOR32_007955 [Pyricularia oryzae]KAI6516465.1 hypothetical protein MCOR10_007709 [Pyricularia oryzae]KAI6536365.1 hypothetical protein MCOR05_005673 [Pyricularia oryzae]KAI6592558.1 hypothetical protein MCOR06_004146 [Pyricularia oryzae]KAI6630216.1 hypothetical protein MCOR08_006210 [Pyricularia oryzae]
MDGAVRLDWTGLDLTGHEIHDGVPIASRVQVMVSFPLFKDQHIIMSSKESPSRKSSTIGQSTRNGSCQADTQNGQLPPVGEKPKPVKENPMKKLKEMSQRPLPTQHGDGTYPTEKKLTGIGEDLKHIRGYDVKTLLAMVKSKLKGEKLKDDKTMLMERVMQLVARLPTESKKRAELTDSLINELWESLDHPPLNYLGPEHSYRTPDGSYNHPFNPQLGAAGSRYARSVIPTVTPPGALPDPGLIFDSIMGRTPNSYRKHPNNVSSILWYWATIIIHDIFWTDPRDINTNKSSSYLDLAPLYGNSQEMQDSIRTFKDGRMKPDCYADKRLAGMPPGVSVLLIMFNRFHNHVAENLALINEGGRFNKPSDLLEGEAREAAWKKYDNDLFQVARLVTSGLYINITLVDYVRNIVNLNRVDTTWTLDPRQDAGAHVGTADGAERGTGNAVSAEFNLCYRWHSCISEKDSKFVEAQFQNIFGKPASEVRPDEMWKGFAKMEQNTPADPGQRTFGGFKRGPDGKFDDDDLVRCISEAVEDVAGAFGARNVPQAMKVVETMGIIQGRKWNVAGLNEFRKHFHLKPYSTFEDINSDPGVAEALRRLYDHPDNVELYPGLVAEEDKQPMVPGVGIAPTYTISRVVLSDAVCLVRGDRFYTTDFTPRNLTNWGYKEVDYDLSVNHGCVFYKLFIRAFPNHFKQNSVYAHYPMVVPSENKRILEALGRADLFDFEAPKYIPPRVNITSYGGAKYILKTQEKYKVTWHEGLGFLMGEGGLKFMLSGDDPLHAQQRKCMAAQLYKDGWTEAVKAFYAGMMEELLVSKSYFLGNNKHRHVDIIRDVGNMVHVHFASQVFGLPLKTAKNPTGVFTEQEMYGILAAIFTTIFFDLDPSKSFPLRTKTREVCQKLAKLVEANVKLINKIPWSRGMFVGKPAKDEPLSIYGKTMIKGLKAHGLSDYDIAWSHVVPTSGAMVPNQAQVFAQAVDYYLSPAGMHYIPEIHMVALQPSTPETDALLLGYAMEGIRLAGTFGSYREAAVDDVVIEDNGRQVPVKAGDRVFVSFVDAARDPKHFPDPEVVNPRRPAEKYIHYGVGPHACLGRDASQIAITEMFRCLFRRRNVRRVPGPQGELKKVPRPGGFYVYMREDWGGLFPFPVTMRVMWDDE